MHHLKNREKSVYFKNTLNGILLYLSLLFLHCRFSRCDESEKNKNSIKKRKNALNYLHIGHNHGFCLNLVLKRKGAEIKLKVALFFLFPGLKIDNKIIYINSISALSFSFLSGLQFFINLLVVLIFRFCHIFLAG